MTELYLSAVTAGNLKNFELSISKNGIYGIIGRNGAGKSTLFTIINEELRLKSGQISGFSRVVYVPNLDIFDENLTANDYMAVLSKDEQQKSTKLIKKFSADRFFSGKIKTYSLGMKEIFAFIMTISLESDLIIIDELMNGMDNSMRKLAFSYLQLISKDKIVLLTSHILEEVFQFSDKVYLLNHSELHEIKDLKDAILKINDSPVFAEL